ncbi:hypothetical protein L7F22_023269 [Adiantum nelumboides]|nr:hypothetical protein [Adiantum nelumboides]
MMATAAAVQRRSAASHDELDAHEQLLRDIAALEEVDSCSSLVLQELLQRNPPSPPRPSPLPPFSITGAESKQIKSSPALHQSPLPLQQIQHPHAVQMHHAQNFRHYCPHPVQRVEIGPHLQRCSHQPANNFPASLLHQVLECPTHESIGTGFMTSESSLDHLVMKSRGMTLPALSSGPTVSKKTPASALRKGRKTSVKRPVEKSSTVSHEFPPSEQDTFDTSAHGQNPEKGIFANHFLTERQRRELLNEKYQVLRSLVPNPTKADRASIVQDAIDYVNELKQRADELKYERGVANLKRQKVVDGGLDGGGDVGDTRSPKGKQKLLSKSKVERGNLCTISHKTSRCGTEVDVRIFDDEATIKVTQHQSRRSLLLDACSVLNEAELEILHANGARIGNCHAYMLNVKVVYLFPNIFVMYRFERSLAHFKSQIRQSFKLGAVCLRFRLGSFNILLLCLCVHVLVEVYVR